MHRFSGDRLPTGANHNANSAYWRAIDRFNKIKRVLARFNTSFNVRGEPMLLSPAVALGGFYGTRLSVLALGDFMVDSSAS